MFDVPNPYVLCVSVQLRFHSIWGLRPLSSMPWQPKSYGVRAPKEVRKNLVGVPVLRYYAFSPSLPRQRQITIDNALGFSGRMTNNTLGK